MEILRKPQLFKHGITLLRRCNKAAVVGCTSTRHYKSKQEPDYLSAFNPPEPVYDLLNVCSKSYDFTVLERFSSHVHKTAHNFGLSVTEAWASPPQILQIETIKPRSTAIDQTYKLNLYERNVQIEEFPCYLMPVFVEVLNCSLPEGVTLSIHHHETEHEEVRYIPDIELRQLKTQLDELNDPNRK